MNPGSSWGQRCAVGSRDPLNLYTNCLLLPRRPVNRLPVDPVSSSRGKTLAGVDHEKIPICYPDCPC